MDSTTNVWIVPRTCTFDGISEIESLIPYVQNLLSGSTREEIKNARLGVFLYVPSDEMQIKSLNFLKEKAWTFNYDNFVFASAEMVICVEKKNISEPQDKIIIAQKNKENTWILSPEIDVMRLTQKKTYDSAVLKQIFPDEPFVRCPIKLVSPFIKAAQAISDQYTKYENTNYSISYYEEKKIAITFSSRDYHRTKENKPDDFIECLRSFDQTLLSLGPAVAIKKLQGYSEILKKSFEYITIYTNILQKEICVPNPQKLDSTNALIYLVITGAIEADIPLSLARGISEKEVVWDFSLDKIQQIALPTEKVPEIPNSGVKISFVQLMEHTLNFANSQQRRQSNDHDNSSEVAFSIGWRNRNDKTIIDGIQLPLKVKEYQLPEALNLMRVGKKLVWMSVEQPPDGLVKADPNLLTISVLRPKIQKCLEVWRPFALEDNEKREGIWKDISEGDVEMSQIVKRIAESIFALFAPWPDPFHLRAENDEAWSWPPDKCLTTIVPWFKRLAQSPLRSEPSDLICTFLYLIASERMICHVWPDKIKEAWQFKLRTQDHSWIKGTIWETPDTMTEISIEPLKVESDWRTDALIYCGKIGCRLSEKKS